MAGPGAKGGMFRKGSNGKRVLITKSMAKQMASEGMSAKTDEEYADQAKKLREQNNAKPKEETLTEQLRKDPNFQDISLKDIEKEEKRQRQAMKDLGYSQSQIKKAFTPDKDDISLEELEKSEKEAAQRLRRSMKKAGYSQAQIDKEMGEENYGVVDSKGKNNVNPFRRKSKDIDSLLEKINKAQKRADDFIKESKDRLKDSKLEDKKDELERTLINRVTNETPRKRDRRKATPGKNDMVDFERANERKARLKREAKKKQLQQQQKQLEQGKIQANKDSSSKSNIKSFERREKRIKRQIDEMNRAGKMAQEKLERRKRQARQEELQKKQKQIEDLYNKPDAKRKPKKKRDN